MSKVVLDASAILALLNVEPGAEMVQQFIPDAIVSSVNLAEVVTYLSLIGMPERQIQEALSLLGLEVIPFDDEQAFQAGLLASKTHAHGLSLGDRACLTLAFLSKATALTADRNWKELDLPVEIHLIR